jgi:antiviral helicase SKI2
MTNKEKLEKLQKLLREEESKEIQKPVVDEKALLTTQQSLSRIGVIPPLNNDDHIKPTWKRRISPSMYSFPTSAPALTTLVPLNSLPQNQRDKCIARMGHENDENGLVEIPLSALAPQHLVTDAADGSRDQLPSHRPLTGNLSSKLTEYTRGQVGVRRPFRPGGMTKDESYDMTQDEHKETLYPSYCSPEDIDAAYQVLEKGSIASWKDGTILTSPPGASFDIGLSLSDVNQDTHFQKGCEEVNKAIQKLRLHEEEEKESKSEWTQNKVTVSLWNDPSLFEDDSLFGDDSSSSSDEDSSSSDDSHDNGSEDGSTGPLLEQSNGTDATETHVIPSHEQKEPSDYDIHDIDAFLNEIDVTKVTSRIDHVMMSQKRASSNINIHNPLTIAEDRKSNKERKCWAVTTQLDVSDFYSVIPNPAITYPFELDGFQKQAIARLERRECIFVAAHTSAGKTVCAEYAIALARKHCTRAIYTSPIKALSNQKYRDFKDKFGDDVGLITGDLQINADSSCLIMTTEILRSMLYRGADLIRDIEWVIFDEVHYINDTERGVVWEEVIIMLPDYVNMIFLSATTPNTIEFSDWIGRTKKKPVHVIKTDYRPVPLSHYLYAGRKLHLIMEGKSGFLDKGWKEAGISLLPASERNKVEQKGKKTASVGTTKQSALPVRRMTGSAHAAWQQSGSRQDWTSLVKFLEREMLMPTVVFSFSKKKCEEIANMLRTMDLNTAAERNTAHAFAIQTMKRLSPRDASLPQVISTCEMVKRGIGVHHGGLLPILKEMVEILFSRNLIKVLFATETFAMGVNMPAKAVVFNSIRKHDGTKFRVLEPGEYTQMAGRAGRRGLDSIGTVIMCCFGEEPPPQLTLRNMLTGSSTKLQSQFRLTYNMILNLLRVEDMTVEGMIKRSFSEFATQRALVANDYPSLLKRGGKALTKLENEFEESIGIRSDAEDIVDYFLTSSELLSSNQKALTYLMNCVGETAGGALTPGRILLVTSARKKGFTRAPAIVVKAPIVSSAFNTNSQPLVCIVLLPSTYTLSQQTGDLNPKEFHINYVGVSKKRYFIYSAIELNEILCVSTLKHKIDENKLFKGGDTIHGKYTEKSSSSFFGAQPVLRRDDDFGFGNMKALSNRGAGPAEGLLLDKVIGFLIESEREEMNDGIAAIEYRDCLKGSNQGDDILQFGDLCSHISQTTSLLRTFKSHYSLSLEQHYKVVEKKETLRGAIQNLKHLLSNESLQLFPDFLQRKSLLRFLDYIDDDETVKVKGRVACECNTCDELIISEIIFDGVLNDLDPPEMVAALSALIFQEKAETDMDSELPEKLRDTCERMRNIAMELGHLQKQHGLMIEPKDYADNALNFGLVHVVYDWARGLPFSNICQLTTVQEGSIVRTIVRLDELCREVRNCSRVVGSPTLFRKMEEASACIKRDIVFASSLYVT